MKQAPLHAQIVASMGPSSAQHDVFLRMVRSGLSVVRMNFSWGDIVEHTGHVELVRQIEQEEGINIPLIVDLPGPRIQEADGHTYDKEIPYGFSDDEMEFIRFGIEKQVDYFALSFVGSADDVVKCTKIIRDCGGKQRIIAKIERQKALDDIDRIIEVSDAIMIARGDLGSEVPIEKIPFIQGEITKKCNKAGKPVITATEMLLSMVSSPIPTRAEVTDVAYAILQGSDTAMLSNETTTGKYPVEAVAIMEKVIQETEGHFSRETALHPLTKLNN